MQFKSKEVHSHEIKKLQATLRHEGQKVALKSSAASNTLRNGDYKKKGAQLDLSSFCEILELNVQEKWIVVEPRITFAQLCQFTLPYGLIPAVVPEFSTITVGGAIMGAALESSSHRFGQVSDTCLEYECLLGNGELISASPSENADLFYACSGSYGTLAILTAVKMQLIPAKKWVRLTYHPFSEVQKAIEKLITPHPHDYIEGIVYNPSHAVVITGEMCDAPGNIPIIRQSPPWSPWYVQQVLQSKHSQECMPIKDYLFRLDKGAFWIGQYAHSFLTMTQLLLRVGIPKIKKGGFNPSFLFRLLFGWAFSSQKLYHFWHRVPNHISEQLFFIHDFYTPIGAVKEVLPSFMEQTGIFPIWLCPVKRTETPQILSPHFGGSNFLNIGLYGVPKSGTSIPELSAQLEKEISAHGGRKMLYSFTYYDHPTFAKIYSENLYNEIRLKFSAENTFPSLYDKVTNRS